MPKCITCKKKGMVFLKCPCEKQVCLHCKENHGCTHDYRLEFQTKIIEQNPVVKGSKLEKI